MLILGALGTVMNRCPCLCSVWVHGINHPCGFLVISTALVFTLIASFPKHTLTQKEWTFCSQCSYEECAQILDEFRNFWFPVQPNFGYKCSFFFLTEQ